jgi:leucyl aminopeptidase
MPDAAGKLRAVLAGCDARYPIWSIAHLPALLPAGHYRIESDWPADKQAEAALGFLLAQYQFDKYKKLDKKTLTLALPKEIDLAAIRRRYDAIALVRDLINMPPNDMSPPELAEAARTLAKRVGAKASVISGDDLLKQNFPAIHAVGKASHRPPQFIEIAHGHADHPLVVLVGKGVTFDTGGLDIKPYAAMKLMKKDMGGAAIMLGLTQLIIEEKLPIRIKTLIPAVENMVGGNAFRPQDIIQTRKGLTVEIGSPDAEGRVILADALFEGDRANPALMIDIATLTGAARTALGTELPALYSNRDEVAHDLIRHGFATADPMWHMPLWPGYAKYVNSPVADITNSPNYNFGGSITAALFLERFISPSTPWVHIDAYAWNPDNLPGRPMGGEAMCLRAIFSYLKERFNDQY